MRSATGEISSPWAVLPALGIAAAAVFLFGLRLALGPGVLLPGYALLVVSVLGALLIRRALAADLLLIALGLGIVSSISVEANLDYPNMALFGTVITLAVLVPYLIDRFVYKNHTIRFPSPRTKWTLLEKAWLGTAVVLAWLILPNYFINSGAYRNWPAVTAPDEVARLFVGVNAVGIWDELFFICVVFTLLRRHLPDWQAIPLQAVIFVSFLWELGYRSWGPAITIPFALVQAFIFTRTRSLPYVITVHLLFDFFVFLVIVHAHHPTWLPIFVY
ncbi:CPBP family intramembrane glutamic endopeptidase [Naasia aerilata]|uniref:CPBP family intramembrane glutamic endopeptidase n=1 Tax=Naasia aerilata TaxID=1162966 RepID=UPI0025728669|nr:CPBP family intramembrane glutamic endopeptidase [Naasia aerilata]